MASTYDPDFAKDVEMVEDESLYKSPDMEANCSYDADGLPGDGLEELWRDMGLAMEIAQVLLLFLAVYFFLFFLVSITAALSWCDS